MEISSKSIPWVCEQNSIVWPLYKSLNRVNPQSSNGLRFNRHKRLFFTVSRQKCTVILTVNGWGISNLTISADLPWLTSGSGRIFKVEKPRAKFSKIGSLNISARVAQERIFFNFNSFGDKIAGEKKKVPNFNTGRIIRNLHFPKLQWLTYISYKNSYLKASRRSRRPPLINYFLRPFLDWISFFSQQNAIAVLVIVIVN